MHVTLDEMVCSDWISMLVLVDTGTRMEISIFINSFPIQKALTLSYLEPI
jgi:hypothetical protein